MIQTKMEVERWSDKAPPDAKLTRGLLPLKTMNAQYQLITNTEELQRAVMDLSTRQAVGLDSETTELDPYLGRLRLIQLASPDGVYIVDLNRFAEGDLKLGDAL